jgi:hypothetical protein
MICSLLESWARIFVLDVVNIFLKEVVLVEAPREEAGFTA